MTELKPNGLKRKTSIQVKGRDLVVELFPGYLEIRESRCRTGFPITWHSVYVQAARIAAERRREERKAEKSKPKKLDRRKAPRFHDLKLPGEKKKREVDYEQDWAGVQIGELE